MVLIRFGRLRSDRIGHFAGNPMMYLCECEVGMHEGRIYDIFYCEPYVSNYQLKKMLKRVLRIYPFVFVCPLDMCNRLLPGGEKHVLSLPSDRDTCRLLARTSAHLFFTPEEERLGREALESMGILDGTKFVCIYARDSAYLDQTNMIRSPDKKDGWRYHDYRNSDIRNYLPAAEELVRMGYYVIRMGAVVKASLDASNPKIIDYATNGCRTGFLDIYLAAKCWFFLGSSSGLEAIPRIFRRPIAYVDFVPLEQLPSWGENYLIILKKLWLPNENRFMTFREILDAGAGRFGRTQQYEERGIQIVNNSPEEIKALIIEMDKRIKGIWQTREEDEELQQRFRALYKSSKLHGEIVSRIGSEFLWQNRELLE